VAGDLIGETLGQFRIVAKVGQGGMGVVYRATDEKLRRTVALKVLPPGFAADPARRDRFLREARAAAAINDANIATVYDVGEASGRLYIAMELVEGESLRARLANGAMAIPDALKVARGIARGLAKAHDRGLVHRDLKPDNVMVGTDLAVKILDFGLAKEVGLASESAVADAETATAVTTDGQVLGTPAYMSPEQAAGKPVDARSDVFALGIVLYEMVTGAAPFSAPTTMELLIAIARDTPAKASTRNAAVMPELEAVITRCLAKAPEARYASAREVLAALEGIGETSATSRPSAGVATHVQPRKNTWLTAIAAVVLGAAAVVGWRLRGHDGATATPATPSASAQADAGHRGIAMTDHPPPKTNVPEAALAYAKALQDLRDASLALGQQGLAHAVALDPGLAAAHVRLAFFFDTGIPGVDAPASYRAAHELRAQLDERDQMLLRAAEPLHTRSTADLAACEARLVEATQHFPDDAEMFFFLATMETLFDSKPDDALAAVAREEALDPGSAVAVWHLAKARMRKGDAARALEAAARCLDLAPSATSCLRIQSTVHAAEGDCTAVLADAHRQVSLEPQGMQERRSLCDALAASGAPPEALAEGCAQYVAAMDPRDRPRREAELGFFTSTLTGDFDAAARSLDDLARANAARPTPGEPLMPVGYRLALLREIGDAKHAAAIARDFLRRVPGYDDPAGRLGIIAAEQALVATGEVTPQDALSRTRSVVEAAAPTFDTSGHGGRTVAGALFAVETEDVATLHEILATYAEPLPTLDLAARLDDPSGTTWAARGLGKALVLTGDVERGLPLLEQASRACDAVDDAFDHVHGLYWLGLAREKHGDAAGACEAYARVLGYWGHARPRSVTADRTRARMKALACHD
jgi:serine/threonine-protein kinase